MKPTLAELERQGAARHEQMRLEGQLMHAFGRNERDNCCDRCGREEGYIMHTDRQRPLL